MKYSYSAHHKRTHPTCLKSQIHAKRGDMDAAELSFQAAQNQAKISRLRMLEVLVARDWKKFVLEPAGRDVSQAESIIDGACARMKKSREHIARVLV